MTNIKILFMIYIHDTDVLCDKLRWPTVSANCGRWNSPKVPKVKKFKKYYVKSFSTDLSFFTQVMVKDIQTLKCTQS